MIRRCEFERVLRLVRASGVAVELEDLLNPGRTGRPRALSVELYITGAILAADTYQSTTQTMIHHVFARDLARSLCRQHNLIGENGARITIDQVRYLLTAISEHLAPPRPDDDNDADGAGNDDDAGDGDDQVQAGTGGGDADGVVPVEQEVLDGLVDRIIASFVPPELVSSQLALDATAVRAHARGKRIRAQAACDPDTAVVEAGRAADPDATWGYCTRTQDNCSNRVFGYAAFTTVGVPPVGADPESMPKLTLGLRLRPANADVVEPGLALLAAAAAAVAEPRRGAFGLCVMADMAWSFKRAERWAIPARALGVELVFDLHPADRGALDHEGLLIVDGHPHCPVMPEHLHKIQRPTRLKVGALPARATARQRIDHANAKAELQNFRDQIAARGAYACRRIEGPDATGKERFECPAQAGTIRCAACPLSQLLGADLPETVDPPTGDTAPKCCAQRTITLPGDVDAKRRQRLRWGSDEWIAAYLRRVQVEGSYGRLKSSSGANLRRGWCHARRQTKITILLACAIAACNLSLLRAWAKRTANTGLPFCEEDPPDEGFEEVDADGHVDPAPDPDTPPGPPA